MSNDQRNPALNRIHSIDGFRALTMLLMIWVNDFGSLTQIPPWLQHMAAEEDALGFSDILTGISLPILFRSGGVGLLKSLSFAILIIWITGGLNRLSIHLKI